MYGLRIRTAATQERELLEAVQRRASLALPEYREQLLAHPDAIQLPAEQLALGQVMVAEVAGRILGFVVLIADEAKAEIDGLFVEPERWRHGIGSALVQAATHQARRLGLSLRVTAGPSAVAFYERCGFVVEGEAETRFGPAYTLTR